jgi:hypothetical protein
VTVGDDVAVGDGSGVIDAVGAVVGTVVGAMTSGVAVAVMVGKLDSAS